LLGKNNVVTTTYVRRKLALCVPIALFAEAGEEPMERTDVFVSGKEGYHTYRIPALVVTSEGSVLAFCEGRKNSSRDDGDIDLLLKRSTDGGRTWSDTLIVQEEGVEAPITIGNPCPIAVADDPRIHLLFTRNNKRLFYTYSDDDGLTWSVRREITSVLKGFDYSRVLIATGPVHGIRTKKGRLVVPVWLSDREMQRRHQDDVKSRIRAGVIVSDDNGQIWRAGGLVPAELNRLWESTVAELSDGSLLLNMRVVDTGLRATSRSSDGGLTWSSPIVDRQLPCPVCQASILSLDNGEVLFLNPAYSSKKPYDAIKRRDLTLRLSIDDGQSWPHSKLIQAGPAGYSDLTMTEGGEILCIFENGEQNYRERISIIGITREALTCRSSQQAESTVPSKAAPDAPSDVR
jgi:sialidase-1